MHIIVDILIALFRLGLWLLGLGLLVTGVAMIFTFTPASIIMGIAAIACADACFQTSLPEDNKRVGNNF